MSVLDKPDPTPQPQALDARGPKQFSASTCTSIQNELAAGAAAFAAAKEYEANCQANGKASGHAQAKEILAGIAGAIVDKNAQRKGAAAKKPAAKKPFHPRSLRRRSRQRLPERKNT
ncbi:hypothetical protein B0H16DRAFT_1570926 [Mycena metata]|uniref:Uncharacterized protein n=1 Tax=Mycena metata TaxID=1033252 RepID=A0AAD7I9P8_9AGAR|nr:hypothetical protein B0H16DRAFT_1570926 [Mycena metata]